MNAHPADLPPPVSPPEPLRDGLEQDGAGVRASQSNAESTPPISLGKFLETTGASSCTAWRWEKRGWLSTVRIAGRKYITAAALREFNRRLEAGEFAGKIQNPMENRSKK